MSIVLIAGIAFVAAFTQNLADEKTMLTVLGAVILAYAVYGLVAPRLPRILGLLRRGAVQRRAAPGATRQTGRRPRAPELRPGNA